MSWFARQCFFSIYKPSPEEVDKESNTVAAEEKPQVLDTSPQKRSQDDQAPAIVPDIKMRTPSMDSKRGRSRKSMDDLTLVMSPRLEAPSVSRRTSIAVGSSTNLFGGTHRRNLSGASRKNEIDLSIAALQNIVENLDGGGDFDLTSLPDQLNNVVFLLKKYKTDYEAPAVVRERKMKKFVKEQLRNQVAEADEDLRKFINSNVFNDEEIYGNNEPTESALDFFTAKSGLRAFTMNGSQADLAIEKNGHKHRHGSMIHNKSAPASVLKARLADMPDAQPSQPDAVESVERIQAKSTEEMKRRLQEAERVLANPDVQAELSVVDDWTGFNIWQYRDLVNPQPLFIMMAHLFTVLDLFDKFSIKQSTFSRFFTHVERGYLDNPYHNALHATDVVQNMYSIIKTTTFSQYISPLDVLAGLVAAAIHDMGHPGTNNAFQVASNSELALRYNDKSVLENFHIAEAFRILQMSDCDILAGLDDHQRRQFRQTIIAMVLATDMQEHIHVMSEMETLLDKEPNASDRATTIILLRSALHCADVGNPSKNQEIYSRWVDCIIEEWYLQGDRERELGLEVSPLMDRHKPGVAKSQVGFIRFFIQPMFRVWAKIIPECAPFCDNVQANLEYYTQLVIDTPQPTPSGSRRTSLNE